MTAPLLKYATALSIPLPKVCHTSIGYHVGVAHFISLHAQSYLVWHTLLRFIPFHFINT